MPVVQLSVNIEKGDIQFEKISLDIAKKVSDIFNKPLSDVMVLVNTVDIFFDSSSFPAAFMDIRYLSGYTIENARHLCEAIAQIIEHELNIQRSRFYCNFTEVESQSAWRFIDNIAVCAKKP